MRGPFVHEIDPVLAEAGGLCLWYYGLAASLGLFALFLWLKGLRRSLGITPGEVYGLSLLVALCALLSGRLVDVVLIEPDVYRGHPWRVFAIWLGGISPHGLLLGAGLAALLFCRARGRSFLRVADALALAAATYTALSCAGSFIDGRATGAISSAPFAVAFPGAEGFRHPVVLYHGLKNVLLVLLLVLLRRTRPRSGMLLAHGLLWGGLLGLAADAFRAPDGGFLGLAPGQAENAIAALLGAACWIALPRRGDVPRGAGAAPGEAAARSLLLPRAALGVFLLLPLVVPSARLQDVPARYGWRHPGLRYSALYPRVARAPSLDAPAAALPEFFPAEPNPAPLTAEEKTAAQLQEDLQATRHAADGGGSAWLEAGADGQLPHARAGTPGAWTIVYRAGPLGVAAGGHVFLQVGPFWGWSTPQVENPAYPGFTEVSTSARGVELEPRVLDEGLLGVEVKGRALEPGEIIRFAYGAGSAGALADRYAERGARFWIAVDGDGDGVRALLENSPALDVLPGPAARLVLTLQSSARRGEAVPLVVAVLDATGSVCTDFEGEVELSAAAGGLVVPEAVILDARHQGARRIEAQAPRPGVFRVAGRLRSTSGTAEIAALSNPVAVDQGWPRILWGDLHGHSGFSDGTGLPEDYYRYARDVAALDFAALTDHDHYGMLFLDQHPFLWDEIRAAVRRFHEPGRFVALLGYEWTSWIHGHRHVVFFQDDGEVLSSLNAAYRTPAQLWEGLRGRRALTFAHHSAGGPIATNWSYRPDPDLEPVTEVCSVHGSSEALDAPNLIYRAVRGNTVRDALDHGLRFGFAGSGDGHDGHPGLAHLAAPSGGLAAVFAEETTREGILAALRSRRAYATNGARLLLDVQLGGRSMGSTIVLGEEPAPRELTVRAIGTGPLAGVEVIRGGQVVVAEPLGEALELETTFRLEGLRRGEYVYVRVTQFDLENPQRLLLAWSSPFFIE